MIFITFSIANVRLSCLRVRLLANILVQDFRWHQCIYEFQYPRTLLVIFLLNFDFKYRTLAPIMERQLDTPIPVIVITALLVELIAVFTKLIRRLANIRSGSITLVIKGSVLEWGRHGMRHNLRMALCQEVHKLWRVSSNIGNMLVRSLQFNS